MDDANMRNILEMCPAEHQHKLSYLLSHQLGQPLLDVPDIVRGRGMRLHIHLAEAHMEHEHHSSHDAWPELEAESFRALRSRGVGVSSTQFVDHLGVLGPDCHIAHGAYMTERDRALLRARGTSVALCPRSNEVIGLDLPPVAAYLREGNQICVGTVSLSSSPSLDPLADVALLYRIAREQGYSDADLHQRLLGAVTLGLAAAMRARLSRWAWRGPGWFAPAGGVMLFLLLPLTGLWPVALSGPWALRAAFYSSLGPPLAALVTLALTGPLSWPARGPGRSRSAAPTPSRPQA